MSGGTTMARDGSIDAIAPTDSAGRRAWLRTRFGAAWFAIFAGPYPVLCALVLISWRAAPLWTLAAFLSASVWHFGTDDGSRRSPLEAVVRGGLPIALPVLLHPAATMQVFAVIAGVPIDRPLEWLVAASFAWLVLAADQVLQRSMRRELRSLAMPAFLVVVFATLPPLTAFALYFVCIHAPALRGS